MRLDRARGLPMPPFWVPVFLRPTAQGPTKRFVTARPCPPTAFQPPVTASATSACPSGACLPAIITLPAIPHRSLLSSPFKFAFLFVVATFHTLPIVAEGVDASECAARAQPFQRGIDGFPAGQAHGPELTSPLPRTPPTRE